MMKKTFLHTLFAVVYCAASIGIIGGCRGSKAVAPPPNNGSPLQPKIAAEKGGYIPKFKPGFSLKLVVTVSGKREVEEPNLRISDSGVVTLPLIGQVKIADLSLDEARNTLAARYREFFVRPEIQVDFGPGDSNSDISPWGHVIVLGRVRHPGRIKIPPTQDLTVSSAIQQAGGFDTSAKENAIRITRKDAQGKNVQLEVNLHNLGAKGNLREDPVLQPGDVVYVPESVL